MTTIGYLRVSTTDQNLEKNKADILAFANDHKLGNVEWIEERVSGCRDWKQREIGRVIETLRKGDTIITPEFSRLARSTLQILSIVEECKRKGISLYVVKGNWTINGQLDSKVLLLVFSMVAEIERELISARTREALAARKAAGVRLGRPRGPGKSKLDQHRKEIEYLLSLGCKHSYLAQRFNTSRVNVWKYLKGRGIRVATDTQAPVAVA